MRPVDSHCHLDFDRFDEDRTEVIERAGESLEFVVVAGCNPERNQAVKELCKSEDLLVPNYGLHPTFTDSFDELDEVKDQVRDWDPVAIGEIGLDHHHVTDEDLQEQQEKVFREMLELAEELDKPVVIHSRSAEKQAIDVVEEYDVTAMFHCFNGSIELAERIVENGDYIGVTTQVLYSSRVQKIAENIPLNSMLLETDSPFLYPDGRNEPVHVLESAEKIGNIKDMSPQQVMGQTTENARKLFKPEH
ncbi:TatD family hydrolase [Candidatus Nanohalococcus occultus]|uniref:TatD family hydrolase n=1 Tax=Candidatus Nanohalococcus occultus TaxID=2978047 RepID=UPI0039E0A354